MKVAVIMANDGVETVCTADVVDTVMARVRKKYHDEWRQSNPGAQPLDEPYCNSGHRFVRSEIRELEQ